MEATTTMKKFFFLRQMRKNRNTLSLLAYTIVRADCRDIESCREKISSTINSKWIYIYIKVGSRNNETNWMWRAEKKKQQILCGFSTKNFNVHVKEIYIHVRLRRERNTERKQWVSLIFLKKKESQNQKVSKLFHPFRWMAFSLAFDYTQSRTVFTTIAIYAYLCWLEWKASGMSADCWYFPKFDDNTIFFFDSLLLCRFTLCVGDFRHGDFRIFIVIYRSKEER